VTVQVFLGVLGPVVRLDPLEHILRRRASHYGDDAMTFLSKQNMGGLATDSEGPDHSGMMHSVTMSSNGDTVESGSLDKTLRVYTLSDGSLARHQVLTGCNGEVMSVSLSLDALTVAGGSKDGSVRVWQRSTKDERFEPLPSWPIERQHGVTGGGSKLDAFFSSSPSSSSSPQSSPSSSDENKMGVGHTDQLRAAYVASTKGGRRVVFTCGHDATCCVWDLATGALLGRLLGHEGIVSCVSTNDGATLAVSGGADLIVRVWTIDADAPEFVGTLKHEMKGATREICNTAMSPDGRFALTVGFDDAARFWDPVAGVALFTLEGNGRWTGGASISANNVTVFSGGDKLCKLVDCASGEVLRKLAGHEEGVLRCEISRDGSTVITCAFDNTSRVFDTATGQQRHVLQGGHSTYVVGGRDAAARPFGNDDFWTSQQFFYYTVLLVCG
jgi:WD40 repeat protein